MALPVRAGAPAVRCGCVPPPLLPGRHSAPLLPIKHCHVLRKKRHGPRRTASNKDCGAPASDATRGGTRPGTGSGNTRPRTCFGRNAPSPKETCTTARARRGALATSMTRSSGAFRARGGTPGDPCCIKQALGRPALQWCTLTARALSFPLFRLRSLCM